MKNIFYERLGLASTRGGNVGPGPEWPELSSTYNTSHLDGLTALGHLAGNIILDTVDFQGAPQFVNAVHRFANAAQPPISGGLALNEFEVAARNAVVIRQERYTEIHGLPQIERARL